LQYLGLCSLWISKVHHLVQQLVDDDEIVPYALLLEFLKVLCKDLDNFMEKEENFGSIGVSFGKSEKIEVVVSYIQILKEHLRL
jgi:hypothetical protein